MHKKPIEQINSMNLITSYIETPLGIMFAIADQTHLYALEFADENTAEKTAQSLEKITGLKIIEGKNELLIQVQKELTNYFNGTLKKFSISVHLYGTPFQRQSWLALTQIPYGATTSYGQQAILVGNAKAFRAVANANKNNPISIIIPCHRIINSNGNLCGYSGGLHRKKALLEIEKKSIQALNKQ